MKLSPVKKKVYNFIKKHPYCDIDDIVEHLKVRKNIISRILPILDQDDCLIKWAMMKDSIGNNKMGACDSYTTPCGWIIR